MGSKADRRLHSLSVKPLQPCGRYSGPHIVMGAVRMNLAPEPAGHADPRTGIIAHNQSCKDLSP